MVCGGFTCSKNSLCVLNLLYIEELEMSVRKGHPLQPHNVSGPGNPSPGSQQHQEVHEMVSLLLIGIAAWGIGFGLISSLRVVGVAVAVGILLFLIALVGLIGAIKHHQVLLFFYMIILFLVFVVQFSVSCASLAINREQQNQLLEVGWNHTATARSDIEKTFNCCGFHYFDKAEPCDAACYPSHECQTCGSIIEEHAEDVLKVVGGVGFFFSFTEILGVWLTYRYRNQKDPRANPSAFL